MSPVLADAGCGRRWSTDGDRSERRNRTSNWPGELVGLQPHEYDEVNKAIRVSEPLAEAKGRLVKADRPKTPAGKRWIQLPPFLADLYEALLDDCDRAFVFVGEKGGNPRRSNFARRFWRRAWDGDPNNPDASRRVPPILPGFTFHEGRHTHRTWLADDGIPEVAARPGSVTRWPAWPGSTST